MKTAYCVMSNRFADYYDGQDQISVVSVWTSKRAAMRECDRLREQLLTRYRARPRLRSRIDDVTSVIYFVEQAARDTRKRQPSIDGSQEQYGYAEGRAQIEAVQLERTIAWRRRCDRLGIDPFTRIFATTTCIADHPGASPELTVNHTFSVPDTTQDGGSVRITE